MLEYVTVSKLKARVPTNLDDDSLQDIIQEQSLEISRYLGAEPGSPMTDTFINHKEPSIMLTFKPDAGTVVLMDTTIAASPALVSATTYTISGRVVSRNPVGLNPLLTLGSDPRWIPWPKSLQVTYAMADSPGILTTCRGVCIDLCRLAINNPGVDQSESIDNYSHSTKDVEVERQKTLGRLSKIRGLRPVMVR